jgi:hypothetical protein
MQEVLFQGYVDVYLQGKSALAPFGKLKDDLIKYYVGNSNTRITVKDYRKGAVNAVHKIISGDPNLNFTEEFNQPASITIRKGSKGITIEMHDHDGEKKRSKTALLWLGILYDGQMSIHRLTWQIFKQVSETSIAFAAIVED